MRFWPGRRAQTGTEIPNSLNWAAIFWRLDNLRSFDEFLERRFPESRRKAYYLMAIHEHLPRIPKPELKLVGWTKAAELAKGARREGERGDGANGRDRARGRAREVFEC